MNVKRLIFAAACLFLLCEVSGLRAGDQFGRQWIYTGRSSALIYWQLADISASATGCVEYGPSDSLGQSTPVTAEPRWSQLHRLTGLHQASQYDTGHGSLDRRIRKHHFL